eukprot:1159502-Pelagomonas_calceolata.AAC.5
MAGTCNLLTGGWRDGSKRRGGSADGACGLAPACRLHEATGRPPCSPCQQGQGQDLRARLYETAWHSACMPGQQRQG